MNKQKQLFTPPSDLPQAGANINVICNVVNCRDVCDGTEEERICKICHKKSHETCLREFGCGH